MFDGAADGVADTAMLPYRLRRKGKREDGIGGFLLRRSLVVDLTLREYKEEFKTRGVCEPLGSYPGALSRHQQRSVTQPQVQWIRARIEELNLWATPTRGRSAPKGADGTMWMVEGVKRGRYDLMEAWNPEKDHPLRKLGHFLLDLDGFRPQAIDP